MANILIADDSASEATLLARVVTDLGHRPFMAANGNECIDLAAKVQPSLILMDIVMPDLDGFNACRKIRKTPELASIPIVVVSSKSGDSDRFWAERQGANGYITKPFSADQVAAAVKEFAHA